MFTLVIGFIVVVLVFIATWRPTYTSKLYPQLPSPPSSSYLFLIYAFLRSKLLGTPFLQLLKSQYGPLVLVKVPFYKTFVIFTDRKFAKTFFSHKEADFQEGVRIGYGVFPQDIQNLGPSLTPVIARNLTAEKYSHIAKVVRNEVNQFLEENCGKDIDLFAKMNTFQATVMTRIFLGPDIQGKDLERFLALLAELDLEDRIIHRYREVTSSSGRKKTEEHWAEFKGLVKKVVDNRIATKNTDPDFINDVKEKSMKDGVPDYTFISMCVFLSIFAATTNTFAATSWGILFVESNPDIKKKLLPEMQEYMKVLSEGKDPTPLLLGSNFTNRLVNETVRLTTKGVSPRKAMEDINVDDTFFIPKDSYMIFLFYTITASEEIFSNVSEFNPDRFLTEGTGPMEDISFGAGRHPCTGVKLVQMDMKILLYTLLSQYTCKIKEGDVKTYIPKEQIMGVYRPSRTCLVKFSRRE